MTLDTEIFDKALERAKSDAIIKLHRRLDEMRAQRDAMRRCLGFFASVIKSGEPWTDTCQREYDAAIKLTEGK